MGRKSKGMWVLYSLSSLEKKLYDLLKTNPGMSIEEIMTALDIDTPSRAAAIKRSLKIKLSLKKAIKDRK